MELRAPACQDNRAVGAIAAIADHPFLSAKDSDLDDVTFHVFF